MSEGLRKFNKLVPPAICTRNAWMSCEFVKSQRRNQLEVSISLNFPDYIRFQVFAIIIIKHFFIVKIKYTKRPFNRTAILREEFPQMSYQHNTAPHALI